MNDSLKPCLISLFKNTTDDYKLKTINTEVNIPIIIDIETIENKESKNNSCYFQLLLGSCRSYLI